MDVAELELRCARRREDLGAVGHFGSGSLSAVIPPLRQGELRLRGPDIPVMAGSTCRPRVDPHGCR